MSDRKKYQNATIRRINIGIKSQEQKEIKSKLPRITNTKYSGKNCGIAL